MQFDANGESVEDCKSLRTIPTKEDRRKETLLVVGSCCDYRTHVYKNKDYIYKLDPPVRFEF